MRPSSSRGMRPWLRFAVTGVLVGVSQQACTKEPPPAPPADARRGPHYTAIQETGTKVNGTLIVELTVTQKGFEPSPVLLRQGEPVTLLVTRKTDQTCATELVLEDYGIHEKLPLGKLVEITFTPRQAGMLRYGCAMEQRTAGAFYVE
ncbi:copper transporter [Corallococcus sp. c25j21]|nr:copper transporter [Corallococcus silvisoli]